MLCGTDIINREKSVDHFRQTGVTPQLSTIYLLLRSRNFIFGGSVVTLTIPVDLLELNTRFETRRTNWKYVREPILCGAPPGGESERTFLAFFTLHCSKDTQFPARKHAGDLARRPRRQLWELSASRLDFLLTIDGKLANI